MSGTELPRKVAVVTGAAGGIGRALAFEFGRRGFAVAVSDVGEAALTKTVRDLTDAGVRTLDEVVDVADRDAVHAHAARVVDAFGRVDVVVNNAGVAMSAWASSQRHEDLRWLVDVDFYGVVHGTEAFLPHLIASGDGYLANISSVFGFVGVPKQSAYNAAKFAVRGYTEALRQEVALQGHPVSVSCVHPGGIRTDIARSARLGDGEDAAATSALFDALARTTPEQAARTIVAGLRRRKARILVGPDAYLFEAAHRVLGAGYQPLFTAVLRRTELGR
ncbi:SDR family NAD(P)-dependent oxidoreductase [Nitriliruptoraceae bacterium ZYF776]|nr:SDR family NAD(P)-dependent oxidoreductase [Profundirhabdus halotolerans]